MYNDITEGTVNWFEYFEGHGWFPWKELSSLWNGKICGWKYSSCYPQNVVFLELELVPLFDIIPVYQQLIPLRKYCYIDRNHSMWHWIQFPYLWYSEFEKNDKPSNRRPSWDIAEKILKTWNPELLNSLKSKQERRKKIFEILRWKSSVVDAHLKLIPLAKPEDRKQTDPKPNQKLDLEASFHIIRSVASCPILYRLLRSSSLASETIMSQRLEIKQF